MQIQASPFIQIQFFCKTREFLISLTIFQWQMEL